MVKQITIEQETIMNTSLLEQVRNSGREAIHSRPQVRVRRIVTTTDLSSESRAGTDYAMLLAKKFGASVVLLHVIEPLPNFGGMEAVALLPTPSEMSKQARTRLKKMAERERSDGLRVSAAVRTGKAFHGIIAAAAECRADLIVMATHGYTGFDHALLGSTAERVVRHAPCSVLIVPAHFNARATGGSSVKIARLLVPLDFSNPSKTALPWAARFAESFDAETVLFNVTEIFPIDRVMGREMTNHAITPLMEEARVALERMANNLSTATGVKASASVSNGVPHKEICRVAHESGTDLIVLTTHGYSGLKHSWLGSTAERVVRRADCPVLVVRDARKPHAA